MSTVELIEEIKTRPRTAIRCARILVPVDGSGQSFAAVSMAVRLAAAAGAELTLFMAVDYDKEVAAFEQVSLSGYVPAELKAAAYRLLADLMHVIPPEVKAHTRVEAGDSGEVIVETAAQEESDLIVMGSRGLGAIHGLLMGSVSSYVLEHASCPVLLCKDVPEDWGGDAAYSETTEMK
ncbi:Nucleotide-binding universal stress protein, UspA family [Selenomonas sp. GACV-9]|uniref:universal stress protein n=1 Tax=Selenomonas sp. GACV-9 TaxID=3158782 RepID=UPI0008E3F31E|nr:Nucleotide-binding universal stress protein, UspA family [Selenomonas ruminantium]